MQNYSKYLNITTFEKDWGFYLNTVGSARAEPHTSYPNNQEHPMDHSFTWDNGRILDGYYIVFITKGKGLLESSRTKAFTVKEGTCFLLFPGVWHRYKPDPKYGWEEYWVGFKGSYPDELMKKEMFSADKPFIEVGLNEELLRLFHNLIKTCAASELGYRQVATGITLQILGMVKAASKYQINDGDNQTKMISKAKFLLQESIENPVNLEEIVKELNTGYSKFRKTFKEVTGISPRQYHLNLRLDKAKDLLISTGLSINEIAYKSGFESIFYFSRMFKKKNGLPPKVYRTQGSAAKLGISVA